MPISEFYKPKPTLWKSGPPSPRSEPLYADWIRAVRLRRRWVLAASLAGALAGFLFASLRPDEFRARAWLEAGDDAPRAVLVAAESSLARAAAAIVQSARPDRGGPLWEDELRRAADGFGVELAGIEGIVEVSATASEPQLAADMANAFAAEWIERDRARHAAAAGDQVGRREVRRTQLEARLTASERQLRQLVEQNGFVPHAQAQTRAAAAVDDLEKRLAAVRAERLPLQVRTELVEGQGADSLVESDSDALRGYERELARLRQSRVAAAGRANAAALDQLDARIEAIQRSREQEQDRLRRTARNEYEAVARSQTLLAGELETARAQLASARGKTADYQSLKRETIDRRRALESFQALLERTDQPLRAGAGVRLVEAAIAPSSPTGPRPLDAAGLGLAIGLLLALVFVVVSDQLDRSLKRPGQAALLLGLRELGAVPDLEVEQRDQHMTPAGMDPSPALAAETACLSSSPSCLAECMRGVRTSLLVGVDVSPGVLTVTSASAGEGKSTVAANLAASMAELGRRTLLIDADLRRPRLHQVFDAPNRNGLVDLLKNPGVSAATLRRRCRRISDSLPLFLLPAGVAPHGAPGLLHEQTAPLVLERLRAEFDTIIIDAPPALLVSDARVLAAMADGTLLVVRAGRTDPLAAYDARTLLLGDGARLLGVVLNSWNPRLYGPRRYDSYVVSQRPVSEAAAA